MGFLVSVSLSDFLLIKFSFVHHVSVSPAFCPSSLNPSSSPLHMLFPPSCPSSSIVFFPGSTYNWILILKFNPKCQLLESPSLITLLIFLPAILIPAWVSSNLVFLMMYSAYKLNKQGDNVQPWHTPFPIWNQSVVPCPVLTVVSWSAYRYHRRQVRWSGIPISLRIFHRLLWSTQSKALS